MFIRCENLVKIYKNNQIETVALKGLNITVQHGELLAIIGASGSGKSTLMNILGGLDRPSAGQVWVDDLNLVTTSEMQLTQYRSTDVGFVWQQGARNLISYMNVTENVEMPMTLSGHFGKSKRQRAEMLLEAVGLDHRKHHRLSELSGGEQQRVAIAVALANEPKILLADEPTGELDTDTALTIYDVLQRLNEQFNMTTIIVSHDPDIARHVNRVINIRDGQIATETVRRKRIQEKEAQEDEEHHLEEVTVVDAAGRLQIPKDFLEHFNIQQYAKMELTDDGILIRPSDIDEARQDQSKQEEPTKRRWLPW